MGKLKGLLTEGTIGFVFGKKGLFARPSSVHFNWTVGDEAKRDSKEKVEGKVDGDNFKCDIRIKI